ncbi:PA2169 family four-helix-bundle protein [Niabella yanshanensis]|uniref:PA2169 family four-helix-bundle protein n=1 Tax=Niabella yanshanensis TaxID=577386 RepID=A0ABZ0W3F1_9BACT|nr:PA2169 family four-helix-bundle protein [Niabella yanshanensis]WQD36535.1 PA2169 family four-helix-bundle protein [Niabella yanshanensis]
MEHKACIDALNDLIQINNDRIVGYQKGIDELKDGQDADLKSLFGSMISESTSYKKDLEDLVVEYGGSPTDGTTVSGKLYRAWMDVKAVFTGGDRETVLNNCEAGEDAAQKAYQMALDDEAVMPRTKELIRQQKSALKASHDQIRSLRDAAVH